MRQICLANHIGKRRYGRLIYTLEGDQFQQRSAIAFAPGIKAAI